MTPMFASMPYRRPTTDVRRPALTALIVMLALVPTATAHAECAWPVKANRETLNVAFPDTASTYWSYRYHLAPGEEIEISGLPIRGRYFSLNTYSYRGVNLDGISDAELGAGPAAATGATEARWKVVLRGGAKPGALPGVLAGTAEARERGRGVLIYRVYVPDDKADPLAGAPLPTIALRDGDEVETLAPCAEPSGSILVEWFIRLFGPPANEKLRDQPIFIRPITAEGFFPNRDNKYLAALTAWQPGRVAVVQAKAPTVPADMRYWSFCSNEYRMPYPVEACLYDAQITTDTGARYTFVISTTEDRPKNAMREAGVNWLPWGDVGEVNILLLRNMLPAPGFAHAIQHVTPGKKGDDVMGEYYPQAKYCTTESFERLGPDKCFENTGATETQRR